MDIPQGLRRWFIIHFIADLILAIPLFIAPIWFIQLFGFENANPVIARLVAAALFGIGGTSFLIRNATVQTYQALLTLKIIWSTAAIIGSLLAIIEGASTSTWIIIALFLPFSIIWIYYQKKLSG
jgi:hypothetical protein